MITSCVLLTTLKGKEQIVIAIAVPWRPANYFSEPWPLSHNYLGTEHVLLGLIREDEGIAVTVLMHLGLKLDEVRQGVVIMVN